MKSSFKNSILKKLVQKQLQNQLIALSRNYFRERTLS